ncbi:MobF family relaxase [Rhodococcus sp. NPDC003318]|uniref:MobF family relaxase n=1 Tax=Rhodococcus sp. NPDC003318 TaxID=3364503 RepID=UPI00368CC079
MTLHVLHAGDGYEYLTKQVANADRERARGEELTDYYNAHGTPPGHWFGAGLDGLADIEAAHDIDPDARIAADQTVTEAQMKALYGEGLHPNADTIQAAAEAAGMTGAQGIAAAKLGRKFPSFKNEIPVLDAHQAAVEEFAATHGRRPTAAESDEILTRIGAQHFRERHGRAAATDNELRNWIAAEKGRIRHPAAGFDLVFTPPKSVSSLWALAGNETRSDVERIHHEAVRDALRWIEKEACFTRTGAKSEEQRDTTGIVAALYDHYDSRAGDPNLHTHSVLSIKVQTADDGRWRALDGATLHRYAVAASQRYNATIMRRMHTDLGLKLTTRHLGNGKQSITEIAAIPEQIRELFSSRRTEIEVRRDELVAEYRAKHERMPDARAMYSLYQQANLDTREGKAEPKSLAEMRAQWRTRAAEILGSEQAVDHVVTAALTPDGAAMGRTLESLETEARTVLSQLADRRSRWQAPHIISAAEAHLAGFTFATNDEHRAAVDALVAHVEAASIAMPKAELPPLPDALTRRDGEFILTGHGTLKHTAQAVLDAETALLAATDEPTAHVVEQQLLDRIITDNAASTGRSLNTGQRELAEHFVGSGALVAVGIGPAGTGKTTSMKAVVDTWRAAGHNVIALAPSAVAAETLGAEVGTPGLTIATLTYPWRGKNGNQPGTVPGGIDIRPGTMLLVDEASLASTQDLAAVVEIARSRGAIVRLLGDPAQLDAVETGGALRFLAEETDAPRLREVVRFGDDTEQAENSLDIRDGHHHALDLYYERGLVTEGTTAEMVDAAVENYLADRRAGLQSILMLPTVEDVRRANLAVQEYHRGGGTVDTNRTVTLSDELSAGAGDTIVTRTNARDLRPVGGKKSGSFVRNGDLWTVLEVHPDGRATVRSLDHGGTIVLPASYLTTSTELGYASTVHRSQGITVDTGHVVTNPAMDRAGLYVAVTRGRTDNRIYIPIEVDVTLDTEAMHLVDKAQQTGRMVLEGILDQDNGHRTAIEELREATTHAADPERLREAYLAAQTRLRTTAIDRTIERTLPHGIADELRTDTAGYARLRAVLADLHDRGHSVRQILAHAVAERPLAGADSVAGVLAHRIEQAHTFDSAGTPMLPPLPVRDAGTDHQLHDFARECAARYSAALDRETADTNPIGAAIREYRDGLAALDADRVHTAATAAFGADTADEITGNRSVWRLSRLLRRANLADVDPVNMLRWHGERITADDKDITAATLTADIAPMLNENLRTQADEWLAEHADALATHLPTVARQDEDPRRREIATRIQQIARLNGKDTDTVLAETAETAGQFAPTARVLGTLTATAEDGRALTNPDAPSWITAPPADAHTVDAAAAQRLDDQYRTIAEMHRDRINDLAAADSVPGWVHRNLGAQPGDTDLAHQWRTVVADADAYRHTHNVTDRDSLTGPRPANGEAASDWLAVERRRTEYERARGAAEQLVNERRRRQIEPITRPDEPNMGKQRRQI